MYSCRFNLCCDGISWRNLRHGKLVFLPKIHFLGRLMHQHAQTRKTNEKWLIFTLAYLVMVLFGFVLQSLPPLFQHITSEIPFSHLLKGFLMGAFGIPGLF